MLGETLGGMLALMGPLLGGGLSELQDHQPGHGGPGITDGFRPSMSSMQTTRTSTGEDGEPVTTITTERTVNGATTTEIRVLRNGVEGPLVDGSGRGRDGRPLQMTPEPFGTVRRPLVNIDTGQRQADTLPEQRPPTVPSGPVGAIASLLGRIFG